MSPIGRVFIVLNLALAGGFAWTSGTYLQKQDNYKQQLERANKASAEKEASLAGQISKLEQERQTFEVDNGKLTADLGAQKVKCEDTGAENMRLQSKLGEIEGSYKKLVALQEASQTEAKSAFDQSKAAFAMAIADQKLKDEAVNAKNAAEAENRTLKTTIASMTDTVTQKDLAIAGLEKDKSELGLLVSVATVKGFLPAMAAPSLAGTVTNASAKLCTIQIQDNPGKVDIGSEIARQPFRFALYDASGYKGEAVATRYEASANAVLCNIFLVKDAAAIKEGDKAATQTN